VCVCARARARACVCVFTHKHTCELDEGLWRICSRGCLWTADNGGGRRFSVPVCGPGRICACRQNAGRRGPHQLVCIGKRNRRVAEMLEFVRVFTSWGHFGACMYGLRVHVSVSVAPSRCGYLLCPDAHQTVVQRDAHPSPPQELLRGTCTHTHANKYSNTQTHA